MNEIDSFDNPEDTSFRDSKTRYQITLALSDKGKAHLSRLSARIDGTEEEVLRRAIALYQSAVEHIDGGYDLVFRDPDTGDMIAVRGVIQKGK